jgi:hypothetical protein
MPGTDAGVTITGACSGWGVRGQDGVAPTTADAIWGEPGVKIAIIGAGNVGTAGARAAIETGNEVTLTAADSGKARRVAAQIGATAAGHNAEAVEEADIAVLAVPFTAVGSVAQEIRDAAAGKSSSTPPTRSRHLGRPTAPGSLPVSGSRGTAATAAEYGSGQGVQYCTRVQAGSAHY